MLTNHRVAIVQSYVPQYRVPFFDRLVSNLLNSGIECVIVAGEQREWAASRGHPRVTANWLRQVGDSRSFSFGQTGPRFYGYGTARHWRDCDGVIMPHSGTNVDLNLELHRKPISGRRVGVWGHLSRSVKAPNPLDLAVERWQMRRSDHIFAYTRQGADMAVTHGISEAKVTAVMNSIETHELMNAYHRLDNSMLEEFSERHSLMPGKIFGYIGSLDAAKRVDFISDTLDRIWQVDNEVKFLFAGRGNQQDLLTTSVARGQTVMLGYGGASEKALLTRISQALINPGRVGLVAVECLTIGIPILTTHWDFHAPEFDYLTPGIDVYESANDIESFTRLILSKVNAKRVLPIHHSRPYPTLDEMIENFTSGVRAMFTQP